MYDQALETTAKAYIEQKGKDLVDKEDFTSDLVEDVQTLESYNVSEVANQVVAQHNLQVFCFILSFIFFNSFVAVRFNHTLLH